MCPLPQTFLPCVCVCKASCIDQTYWPNFQSAPDETTEIRKAKSRCGGDGGEHASQRPQIENSNEQGPSPRESSSQQAKGKFGSKHPRKAAHSRRSPAQQSAPDETTEIRKAKSRCGGDGGEAREPASPSSKRAGAIPAREQQQSTESQRKVRIKAPTKAAHSRRSHNQQSAPDETTEIRESQGRCGGTVASTRTSVPVKTNRQGHPREERQSTESQRKVRIKSTPRKAAHSRRSHSSTVSPR